MAESHFNFTSLLDEYLKDPQYAADFLSEALMEEDFDVFLLSLKDVLRVHGNLSSIAKRARLNRGTLYKLFSQGANPEMRTILAILESLGYKIRITSYKTSRHHQRRLSKTSNKTRKRIRKVSSY